MKTILKYSLLFVAVFIGSALASYFGFWYFDSRKDNFEIIVKEDEASSIQAPAFTLEDAPTNSLKGEIVNMNGELEWQSRLATESASLYSVQTVQQGERLVTGKQSSLVFEFPQSCKVEMSQETDIDIIQTLPDDVVFSQNEGQATYTQVGSYPISIRAKYLLLEVNGVVDVVVDSDDTEVTVSIASGNATAAYNDLNYESHVLTISEGEEYIFNYGTRKGVLE